MCDALEALKLLQPLPQGSLLYTRGGLSILARAGPQLAVYGVIHSYYDHIVVLGSAQVCTPCTDTKLLAQGNP